MGNDTSADRMARLVGPVLDNCCLICTMPLDDYDGGCVRHEPDEILAWWHAMHPDEIILRLERVRLGWSIDHTGSLVECRIWAWPHVIGRYRPSKVPPLADMIRGAIASIPARPQQGIGGAT